MAVKCNAHWGQLSNSIMWLMRAVCAFSAGRCRTCHQLESFSQQGSKVQRAFLAKVFVYLDRKRMVRQCLFGRDLPGRKGKVEWNDA